MLIKLVTDQSLSAPGFRIFYDATATGCGADLTTPSGSFTSPNYPMPYGHNAECIWTITAARGSTIQLMFVAIDIELHGNCAYDYVEVIYHIHKPGLYHAFENWDANFRYFAQEVC